MVLRRAIYWAEIIWKGLKTNYSSCRLLLIMSVLNHGYWKKNIFFPLEYYAKTAKHSRQLVPFNQFHEFAWLIYTHANVSIKLATVMTDSCQHCYTITTWYLREKNDHKGIMQYIDIITMENYVFHWTSSEETNESW